MGADPHRKPVGGELSHSGRCVDARKSPRPEFEESRGDLLIKLEYHRSTDGIPLPGREGLWKPYPVEYKRGKPKEGSADTLQLCAQAMCLEDMLVLITYDVNTEDAAGKKRLRQIAKKCVDYGQRVQNSVFECLLDAGQCRSLQAKLVSIMDPEKDSLRFYYLGNQYEKKVEHFGCKTAYQPEGTLII